MDRNSPYFKQVQLLVRMLPHIAEEHCFALKGGTAINLFVRDLPRLSVDIDLAYLPVEGRDESLDNIRAALKRIADKIKTHLPGCTAQQPSQDSDSLRMLVGQDGASIKIELSPVLRGSVYPPVEMTVTESVEDTFGFASMKVLDLADLYGGKICAALDRQHPRDLFDIKLLLENEGIDEKMRKAFLIYLISHNRPMNELLNPNWQGIDALYANEFASMTTQKVDTEELVAAGQRLIEQLLSQLTKDEKRFLFSFKSLEPDWVLLGLDGVKDLPAVKWKLLNLEKMPKVKHRQALEKLQYVLGA